MNKLQNLAITLIAKLTDEMVNDMKIKNECWPPQKTEKLKLRLQRRKFQALDRIDNNLASLKLWTTALCDDAQGDES